MCRSFLSSFIQLIIYLFILFASSSRNGEEDGRAGSNYHRMSVSVEWSSFPETFLARVTDRPCRSPWSLKMALFLIREGDNFSGSIEARAIVSLRKNGR